jgi:hypothetical protein
MNNIQKNYIAAKAVWEAVKEVQAKKYNDFLALKGLTEDDIDDEDFDALGAEYAVFAKEEIEASASAWESFKLAETELVNFGIALAPANIREKLADNVKKFYAFKKELIDTLLKLDSRTLPAAMGA